jgi:hypothetical protein
VDNADTSFLSETSNFFLSKDKHFISISLPYALFAIKNQKVAFSTQNGIVRFAQQCCFVKSEARSRLVEQGFHPNFISLCNT